MYVVVCICLIYSMYELSTAKQNPQFYLGSKKQCSSLRMKSYNQGVYVFLCKQPKHVLLFMSHIVRFYTCSRLVKTQK